MGYQHQHKKELLQEKSELRRSRESNSASSRPQREEYSSTSESSKERHYEPKHNRGRTERPVKESHARNHNSSSSTVREKENIIQDTSEAALVAAHAYLLTTQPEPRDPRESMHFAAIKSLGLVGDELKQKSLEKEAARHEQKGKRSRRSQSPPTRRSGSPRRRNYKARREDARNIITQARVNRSCYEWDEGNYEDEEKQMGALCFIQKVCRMQVTRVNSANVLDEGLRIGGRGRWMNSKVKYQTN
jgi:hypothetical protein